MTGAPTAVYGVAVVVHQPTDEDLLRLARTALTTSRLVVVDNTPEPVPGLDARLGSRAVVVHNANRGGLAGAYNLAAREILRDPGCHGLFLLDQDSELPHGFFEDAVTRYAPLAGQPFIVGPRIFETTMRIDMAHRPPPSQDPSAARPLVLTGGVTLEPVEFVISSGAFVSAAAFAALGPFAEDLFIESIDVEYCLRGWSRGVPTYRDAGLCLSQRTGNVRRTAHGFAFDYSATRYYYRVRNYVWVLRRYLPPGVAWSRAGRFALGQTWSVLREERDRRAKLTAMAGGAWDGIAGRLGPRRTRRSRDPVRRH